VDVDVTIQSLTAYATAAITLACEEMAQQLPLNEIPGIDGSPAKQGQSKAWL